MSTTVVYASGESGYIQSTGSPYLDAARGNDTVTAFATNTVAYVGQHTGAWPVRQAFLKWDTSAVGTDTVSDVDFEVDGDFDGSSVEFTIEGYVYDWSTTLTSADFRSSDVGIPALGSIISSYDTTGGWTLTAGYNQDMGANANFASAINGAGDTRVVVLSDQQRTESEPSSSEYVGFECTGNTNDARLTITHAPAVLWSAIDDDPGSPDATVITATAS